MAKYIFNNEQVQLCNTSMLHHDKVESLSVLSHVMAGCAVLCVSYPYRVCLYTLMSVRPFYFDVL